MDMCNYCSCPTQPPISFRPLRHCRITSQGLATLSAFRNLCTLEVVGLPPAVLTSEALGAVVQANPQLTHLDLSTCHSEVCSTLLRYILNDDL